MSKEDDQPPFLQDPDFYFGKAASAVPIPDSICQNISESEITVAESVEEVA